MVNLKNDIEMPSKIVLVAKETLKNKDVINYLATWFKNNTNITLVYNLLTDEDMDLISEKNYYDIALINVYAKLDENEQLLNTMSSFLPKAEREMINKSNSKAEKEEIVWRKNGFRPQIEEELFNNYRILPLLFYNNTIAVNNKNTSINDILDGNGNLNFNNLK